MSSRHAHLMVIDDDPAHSKLIELATGSVPNLQARVTHHTDPEDAMEALPESDVDVIFLDYRFPKHSGLDVLQDIRDTGDRRPIVVMTSHGNEYVAAEMTRAGAEAYLVKSDITPDVVGAMIFQMLDIAESNAEVQEARTDVIGRLASLTPRENEVLDFIIAGLTTREIAGNLHRSEKTIKIHRGNLMKKMGANTAGDLVRMAVEAGRHGNRDV